MKKYISIVALLLILGGALSGAQGARRKTRTTEKPEQKLKEAEEAFAAYRFDDAAELLDEYDTAIEKSRKKNDYPDSKSLRRRVDLGLSMLDRVEKITIIDSISIDSAAFINAYRLSTPTGSLISAEAIAPAFNAAPGTSGYLSESGDKMLWSTLGSDSIMQLMESSRLIDGSWETPREIGSKLMPGFSTAYPFLMSDGMTLYFGAKGDESLGGYDIFISRKDGDSFLQPQNIGMPYNSPANDYMLAIDELTGAGWWATDRNDIPGKVTVYVFMPAELRINYPVDTPDLTDRARITDISATRNPDTDYSKVLRAIEAVDEHSRGSAPGDFTFTMPGGKIYTRFSDFKSQEARAAMADYLDAAAEIAHLKHDLERLRDRYRSGDRSTGSEILQLEAELKRNQASLKRIANSVIRAEIPAR